MNVRLISITRSLIEEEISPEELIVYTARVSNPSNQLNTGTADKLIAYLIKNKHWSPFEMVDMTVEVKTSRAIAAQILRHWSLSFQEFSQRYAEVVDMEPVQLRKAGATNRQSSTEVFNPEIEFDNGVKMRASVAVELALKRAQGLYTKLLDAGVAKECARMVLPLTTQTTIYMKGSVRDWIHYLIARTDPHAQLEHQQVAQTIAEIFKEKFPNIVKALDQ